ncbi:MAG TPA: 30S ribosomal protein S4 [Thermodesulfovibrionales bacterium]|nr:30S ribosomal protein S4 [Thermodesulfovibrionales bacterium]
MSRYIGAVCRLCRRTGEKLYFKGDRCFTEKCGIERRKYPPGQHGQSRGKLSDYGVQLMQKQKVRKPYGLVEKQFRKCFHEAERRKGVTGEVLLQLLECRLDNIVSRLGFSANRRQARQLITHGHFLVNGRAVNIPSYNVKAGDIIEVKESSRGISAVKDSLDKIEHRGIPSWLEMDFTNFKGKVLQVPSREEIQLPFEVQEQLIVELYSK